MTDAEIKEGNHKIQKHNKFCFMKKQIPLYKRIVPLSECVTCAIISISLLFLPTVIKWNSSLASSTNLIGISPDYINGDRALR